MKIFEIFKNKEKGIVPPSKTVEKVPSLTKEEIIIEKIFLHYIENKDSIHENPSCQCSEKEIDFLTFGGYRAVIRNRGVTTNYHTSKIGLLPTVYTIYNIKLYKDSKLFYEFSIESMYFNSYIRELFISIKKERIDKLLKEENDTDNI